LTGNNNYLVFNLARINPISIEIPRMESTPKLRPYFVLLKSLFFLLILSSCDKFNYSPHAVDVDQKYSNINSNNIQRLLDNPSEGDTIRLIVLGDTQRFYYPTEKLIKKINKLPKGSIDFVVHTGDLVDFGLQKEYNWIHELLKTMNYPYMAVIGNHDMVGNGKEVYRRMYGDLNFSFKFKQTKFIYIHTNSREEDFSDMVPDVGWLDAELSDTANYTNAIVVSHVAPHHSGDFSTQLETEYIHTLEKYKKTLLYINGHNHKYSWEDVYENDIWFLNTYSTSHEKALILKIWDGGYGFEILD